MMDEPGHTGQERSLVMRDLARFGPDAPPDDPGAGTPVGLGEARRYCHALAGAHRENFHVLSRLVPARFRDDFAAVYAFCRWSDDLGDETGRTPEARERAAALLDWWRGLLREAVAWARAGGQAEPADQAEPGRPRHPVMLALSTTIRTRALDDRPFHDLLDAFERDQRQTRYATWDELLGYCRCSADPVGRIVLALAGIDPRDPAHAGAVARSDAVCTALQLTNFWQDVRRDLIERDRVYLPSEEIGFGAEELRAWAERPNDSAARVRYIRAVRGLVERTRVVYREGKGLPDMVGREFGPVVGLFMAGGEATLRAVEACGCATLWHRPRVRWAGRGFLIARAVAARYM